VELQGPRHLALRRDIWQQAGGYDPIIVHKLVLGVLLVLDAIEEIAEVTADVAGLTEPEHASAREQLLTRAEVPTEPRRTGDAGVSRARTPREHIGLPTLGTLHCHLPPVVEHPPHREVLAS